MRLVHSLKGPDLPIDLTGGVFSQNIGAAGFAQLK